MKIGVDARPLSDENLAGIGTYMYKVLSELNDCGHEIILYSHKEIVHFAGDNNFIRKVIPGKIGTFWLRYKLPEYLKKDKIDVFWGTQHILPKRTKNIRYVLTVHDLALIKNKKWGRGFNTFVQNVFLKPSVKQADRLIAISQSTKSDIQHYFKIPEDKITLVYNGGVNAENCAFEEVLDKFSIKGKYFLYVGTVEPRKNIISLVKAFGTFAEKHENTYLVIAGGLGWKYKKTLKEIKRSKFCDRIILTGYVNGKEKAGLYKNCSAFVFVSHYEGFGLPLIEAMCYGCPVITAKNSSLAEVGGEAAFYVEDENDISQISAKMEEVFNFDCAAREQIVANNLKNVDRFRWEDCAANTLRVLTEENR